MWDRQHFGGGMSEDFLERFRIEGDVLRCQLIKTWGEWDDLDHSYRRCTDDAILHKLAPAPVVKMGLLQITSKRRLAVDREFMYIGSASPGPGGRAEGWVDGRTDGRQG